MSKFLPLFPAAIVGSIPRPLVVRELIEKPQWDTADTATMDAAIRFVVAMQERAGQLGLEGSTGAAAGQSTPSPSDSPS